MKDKRIRINKRMVAWSDGNRTNIIPSVRRKVDDRGSLMARYHSDLSEGYQYYYGDCALVREECRIRELEADRLWAQGQHLEALNKMIDAAMFVLPDEGIYEDAQWLDPDETLYWHPNVKAFIWYTRRCREYCRQDARLWAVYNGSSIDKDYREYCEALHRWRYDA